MRTHLRTAIAAAALVAAGVAVPALHSAGHGQAARHASHAAATNWPQPQEETFQGCPPQGDGGDAQLNLRKNRIDTAAWQPVPLANLISLPFPRTVEKAPRADWSASDAASVAVNEGRPVIAEGYLLLLRHEGPESPNCHDAGERDYHTWFAASSTDSRAHSLIAELTPRVVARNLGWGDQKAILALKGAHVRIAGWLMLDQEHPEQLNRTRATLWEIHPIMQVQVQRGGKWFDLNTGKPATNGPVPVAPAGPSATSTPGRASSGALRVRVSVSPDPTSDGTATTITGATSPGASCTVRVVYASGSASTSSALAGSQTAGSGGMVSWTWKPSTRRPGPATATVTCSLGGKTATGTAGFTIQ